MTRLLFAHDTRFVRAADGRVYSRRGGFPWDRYLDAVDHIVVVARMDEAEADEDLTRLEPVDHPQVEFRAVPSLSGPVAALAARGEATRRVAAALDDVDVVIARLPSEIGMLAGRLAGARGLPWMAEVVTCAWDAMWNYGNWQGRAYAPLFALRTRRTVRRAPFVLYVTKEFLQRRYPTAGVAVACSDVEVAPPEPDVLAQRLAAIDADRRPFVVGTVAALLPFKGFDTAFAALARARPRLGDVELRILGAGDPTPWQRLAEDNGVADIVRFAGTLPAGEPVLRWLDAVDLYIQPSRQEGLPRAMVEAMARGCPAVGSTAGGIPELLDADCLHKPGDAGHLAALMESAVDTAWRRKQAERNVEVAARYAAPVLDAERRQFLRRFVDAARRPEPLPVVFVQAHAQRGGSERYLELLLGDLDRGWVDDVVCLQDGPLVDVLRGQGLPVTVVDMGADARAIAGGARRLRAHLRARRPAVVHANGVKAALVAGLATLGMRVPVVWVKHDYSWDGPVGTAVALLVEQVVGVSTAVTDAIPGVLRRRVRVVPPGIPPTTADRAAGKAAVAACFPDGVDGPVVGIVGRFHMAKGQVEILEAFPRILEAVPGARLLVVGGDDPWAPDYAAEVRRAAAVLGDRVALPGHRPDVPSLLAGLDVVVVPSRPDERGMGREGFGLVAVEAMAVGTPVVGYADGALPETVGDAALLVAPGDRHALADAVVQVLTDGTLAASLVGRGGARAPQFALFRTVEAMAECYRAVAR